MMKVLLALDQTRISEEAIRMVGKLALPGGSDLFLLHVNPVPQRITGLARERILKIAQQIQEVQRDALEQARLFLSKVEKRFSGNDVHVYPLVKEGFPGEEILKTIRTKNIDLVVLGSRGFSRATGFLLGSVSQWVLQEAPCSVIIAREMSRQKKADQKLKVLLATDGSSDSRAAVEFVKKVALPASSKIVLLHVIKKHVYETERALTAGSKDENEFAELAEEFLKFRGREGANLLKETRKVLSSPNAAIQERLVYGNPATEILKASRYMRANLIVVGSRGTTGVKRMFMGSVSNKVSHSAGCPVAVIRNQHKP